jgi:AbrB family looped-hinge helix DNA binding protein
MPLSELENEMDNSLEIVSSVKVSSKGQFVIPVEIRRAAGIDAENNILTCIYRDGKIVLEVNKCLSPDELYGFFNKPEENGNFIFDLNAEREERAEDILKKGL